ncbi:hypothetical protein K7X08_032912 [Anisodus acutangulus]|uniref:Uncharacterized protein n=1 Tax=Anisodus acutangulus TaxID=402998 RepID=A0A9Q1M1Q7_9SOLA|nr:hypothetical protein K7X08_032912 [Anisodus acutangulus]
MSEYIEIHFHHGEDIDVGIEEDDAEVVKDVDVEEDADFEVAVEDEDIGKNKAAKYAGCLAGAEDYSDSSDVDNEDTDEELDVDAEPGVDLPSKRKSNKVRYDPDCVGGSGASSSRQSTQTSQAGPSNASMGRARGTITRVSKAAFLNAPPPTP